MQPASDGPERGGNVALRRYGPLAIIVVLLLVVGVLVATGGKDDGESANTDGTGPDGSDPSTVVTAGAPEPTGSMPVTWLEAQEAGTLDDYDWGDRCDTEADDEALGHIMFPSTYALPCVPAFEGDNGGATSPGVTADTITVVRYVPDPNSDLQSLLGSFGVADTPEQQGDTFEQYLEMYEGTSELYGRSIELHSYQGTGTSEDVVAARADAEQIISEFEPFAVIGGPGLDRGTFAEVLAENRVLCYECGAAVPDSIVQQHAGFVWGPLPSVNQFLSTLSAWVNGGAEAAVDAGQPQAAQNAVFAGDPAFQEQQRVVGVIHFEQDPPIFDETAAEQSEALADIALRETYLFNLTGGTGTPMPDKATELIAKFKSEGITTIVFLGDPIMPIYLTAAATEQEYFPEWVFTGTALTDTNALARQYDQTQMEAAFGISQLAAPVVQDIQESITTYRWWFGDPEAIPPAAAQYGLIAPRARWLTSGIHMAGPELTPETFEQGLFRIPPDGGGPTTPQVSFGNWGFFAETDYQGIDDSAEIWWDRTVEAQDERGQVGLGVWRRAHAGFRFTAVNAPPPNPFTDPDDTVTVFEELPEGDAPPTYDPPPNAPSAGG